MIFASKTPRDLNHDPEPWEYADGCREVVPLHFEPGDPDHGQVKENPRPEYDHVQNNEPNPILVAFREYAQKHGMDAGERANLAGAWLQARGYYERRLVVGRLSVRERAHAYEVLTRLASLTEKETTA